MKKIIRIYLKRIIMKKKTFNIAIIGLGNIGSYLFNFLNKNKNNISNKNNSNFKIALCFSKK